MKGGSALQWCYVLMLCVQNPSFQLPILERLEDHFDLEGKGRVCNFSFLPW